MNQTTLTVPNWVVDAVQLAQRNWFAFVGTLLLVLVIAFVTQLYKKHWNLSKEEAEVKKLVNRLIAGLSVLFGVAGSLAYFVSQNMPVFKNIPYVAEYIPTLTGVLWGVYNFRLNKTFKKFEAPIAKWSGANKVQNVPPTQTATESQPQPTAEPGQFL